jgi:hypothetical protein
VSVAGAIALLYQFWPHAEWIPKLGWLEYVLNTPSHHRVHHAANPEYLDRNYGGIFIVFDRQFGTFAAERDDLPCRYGLVTPLRSNNPIIIAFHERAALAGDLWRARSWREQLACLIGPAHRRAVSAVGHAIHGTQSRSSHRHRRNRMNPGIATQRGGGRCHRRQLPDLFARKKFAMQGQRRTRTPDIYRLGCGEPPNVPGIAGSWGGKRLARACRQRASIGACTATVTALRHVVQIPS